MGDGADRQTDRVQHLMRPTYGWPQNNVG